MPVYKHAVYHNARWRAMLGAKVLGRFLSELDAAKEVPSPPRRQSRQGGGESGPDTYTHLQKGRDGDSNNIEREREGERE